jgi:hypothetical protein
MISRALLNLLSMLVVGTIGCSRADLYPLTDEFASDGGGTGRGDAAGVGEFIYVAPDGNDSNPGTLSQPLRTVAQARDLVRTKNITMKGGITVYLRGGTYPQTTTLSFGNADSGNGGFYVKYMAYPGERPLSPEASPSLAGRCPT